MATICVTELMGVRAGTALPRTDAFGVNSDDVTVRELIGLRARPGASGLVM